MNFSEKQRNSLIEERGEPILQIEFDVFDGNRVSMWTHFNVVKEQMMAIKNHLDEFLRDEKMCPFCK